MPSPVWGNASRRSPGYPVGPKGRIHRRGSLAGDFGCRGVQLTLATLTRQIAPLMAVTIHELRPWGKRSEVLLLSLARTTKLEEINN